ncbi:MAG: Alkyl hydroperoxide reductase subunit C-like protein, partial [uncultured Nocardioidaceae bacterium]
CCSCSTPGRSAASAPGSSRRCTTPARRSRPPGRGCWRCPATRCTRCGRSPRRRGWTSPCCRTSGRTGRWPRRTASSTRSAGVPDARRSSSTAGAWCGGRCTPRRPRPATCRPIWRRSTCCGPDRSDRRA